MKVKFTKTKIMPYINSELDEIQENSSKNVYKLLEISKKTLTWILKEHQQMVKAKTSKR